MAKVDKFDQFFDEEEIRDIKRSIIKNSDEYHKFPKNSKFNYNGMTRKIDDMTTDIVDDLLEEKRMITDHDINHMINSTFQSLTSAPTFTSSEKAELRQAIKDAIKPILTRHGYEFL